MSAINLDRADDVGEPSGPGLHPDDPEGMDDWRMSFCDSGGCGTKQAQLVRRHPCADPECHGCISLCLECERAQ